MNYRDMWYELKVKMVQAIADDKEYFTYESGKKCLEEMGKIEAEEYQNEQSQH